MSKRVLNLGNSGAIFAAEYDDTTHDLDVRFKWDPSKTYVYPGVPLGVIDAWERNPSPGTFFSENIKNQYAKPRAPAA